MAVSYNSLAVKNRNKRSLQEVEALVGEAGRASSDRVERLEQTVGKLQKKLNTMMVGGAVFSTSAGGGGGNTATATSGGGGGGSSASGTSTSPEASPAVPGRHPPTVPGGPSTVGRSTSKGSNDSGGARGNYFKKKID